MGGEIYRDVARDFLRLAGIAPLRPDLAYLGRLTRAFSRLPYENFTKIIRAREVASPGERPRTPDIVLADHIDLGAGGTCFSLTNFFRTVLEFAGYAASPVMCDRSYGPDTHCALIVPLGRERYLVDPGYLMEEPMLVPPCGESVQDGAGQRIRLRRLGLSSQLILLTERGGVTKLRYRLKDAPVAEGRFRELWIDSFGWAMMRHLTASRQTQEGQIFMRDGMVRLVGGRRRRQDRIGSRLPLEVERAFGIDRGLVSDAEDAIEVIRNEYRKGAKR